MPKTKTPNLTLRRLFKKYPLWTLAACLLILLVSLAFPETRSQVAEIAGIQTEYTSSSNVFTPFQVEEAQVKDVVDGDTIKLTDGRTIRYLNIDTPETVKPNTPVQCFGMEAKRFNEQLVKNKKIWLKADKGNLDRYGRYLRFIFLKQEETGNINASVNANMVRLGFAKTSFYSPNTTYKQDFLKLEEEAKLQQSGLWKSC